MEPDLPFELTLASTGRRLESLHAQLRAAVLDGRLAAGTPLPSSRALAAQLGLGRNTVAAAYARLVAEGYVQPRERARAVVADLRPAQRKAAAAPARSPLGLLQPLWLQPGMAWHPPPAWPERSFRLGMPEHRWFPHATWRRLTARHQRATARSPFAYAPPDGLPALRQAIAGHVAFTRAVACSADDVVVTQGPLSPWLQLLDAQAGLHLAARLRHPGLAAAMAHSLRRHVPGAQWLADYAHPDAAGAAAPGVVFGYGAIDADVASADQAANDGHAARRHMDIGFIGLGVMGAPMAGHLARAGHTLTVLDADAAVTTRVAHDIGARAVQTPAQVAAASEVIVTMLPNGDVVQQVVCGPDGVAQGVRAGALLLDTSSAEPWLTEQTAAALAARGAGMVDAPVSGAAWGAADATLVFMVGGAAADVERVRPLLQCMGRSVHHLGALGCGHAMKCLNNCITAMTFAATSEALVAGKRYGLDPQAMVDVLNESTGGSWITQTHYHQRVFNRAFDDPFKLGLMLKDVGIALQLARQTATPMPMAGLGQQLWRMADHAAGPGASVSELVRWVEDLSGTALTPGAGPRQG